MIRTALFAAILAGTTSLAFAQAGTIPDPSNPTPVDPIATNGTPLPAMDGRSFRAVTPASRFLSFYGDRSTEVATPRAR